VERTLEFRILGPLEVRDGQQTVRLGAAKQRTLLGVLLLHANETVSTERLVDELWGERPPATAEKLVQGYVHALRKQLEAEILQTQASGYRLNLDPPALDLLEFERLTEAARGAELAESVELRREALSLWRGSPLADVVLEGAERHTLARLSELQLTTQIEQIDAELELGRHTQLVGELESLVAAHPYQERLHAQLMLALYRSGRQAEALQAYRAFQRVLSDELGLQPSQELRDLESAILRQDEALSIKGRVAPVERPVAEPASSPPDPDELRAPASRRRRRSAMLAAAIVAGLVAIATAAALLRGEAASITAPPNSVAVIDPATNRVVGSVPVGIRPGPVAAGEGSVWVGNLDDKSLARIDTETRQRVANVSLPATPDGIAVGDGAVWVAHGRLGTLSRVDPQFDTVAGTIPIAGRAITFPSGSVAVGDGAVWAVFGDSTLARVDPTTGRRRGAGLAGVGPAAVIAAFGSVWVSNSGDASVQRFSPITFEGGPLDEFTVGRRPTGMAAGEGGVWVATTGDDSVTRMDPDLGFGSALPIRVGAGPTAVAAGEGAVWVANTDAGTVSRIDPATNEVVETIEVGNAPSGIVVADGLVWVAIQAP